MNHDHISQVAYRLWQERGCPQGSPEIDWERAQSLIRAGEPAAQIESLTGLQRVERDEKDSGEVQSVPTLEVAVDVPLDIETSTTIGATDYLHEIPQLQEPAAPATRKPSRSRTGSSRNDTISPKQPGSKQLAKRSDTRSGPVL